MSASTTFVNHCGAEVVTYDDLKALPAPIPRSKVHAPVPHHEFVDKLHSVLSENGWSVRREKFSVSKDTNRLFGVMDLDRESGGFQIPGIGTSLGLRQSNGGDMSAQIVAGGQVFVCDNLAMKGDEVILKVPHLVDHPILPAIEDAIDLLGPQQKDLELTIEKAIETNLTPYQAKSLFWDLFARHQTIPTRFAAQADRIYFDPEAAEAPEVIEWRDSLWGWHNALTRTIRDLPTRQKLNYGQRLGKVLERTLVALS